ncbi:MAG: AMP-binding protein [Candidatus Eremiobacteraeota bacterium]|nr:AMP-binding protein [Candidatus Eremiobacteraeota bacterium]
MNTPVLDDGRAPSSPTAIATIEARMRSNAAHPALFWNERVVTYGALCDAIDAWANTLDERAVAPGEVCAIIGDYSPGTCALIFALVRRRAIVVPLTLAVRNETAEFFAIAGVQHVFRFDADDAWVYEPVVADGTNALIATFRASGHPGLIVFSSGSTGKPKGILHDCERLFRKFVPQRQARRTVLFLMFDHFGGFNTLLSVFAYGGAGVCVPNRAPDAVCRAIENARADLLPATPTFLNLVLAAGTYRRYALDSVTLITYGTEVMPEATLAKLREAFPKAQLKQTYGLSELGVLHSKSESDGSLWMKIGGAGFEVKVVDGQLWVRAGSNMVGYLNAPQPFDDEGWMCTGDDVEVRGEYFLIKGRRSEMINVGGQKVFPAEVETLLLGDPNVAEATVYGVKHPLMGQVPHARISVHEPEEQRGLVERLRRLCADGLARYKIPQKFTVIAPDDQVSERFKKVRRIDGA